MKRTLVFGLALASVLGLAASPHPQGRRDHRPHQILSFQTLYGVDGPFLGDGNAIRDVEGDEAPWVIR